MPVVIPPRSGDIPDFELKDFYIDENGNKCECVKKVILPSFDSVDDTEGSFNIETD